MNRNGTTDIAPVTHSCVADQAREDGENRLGYGYQQLFEEGYVKIGLCRECLTRIAPCDVDDPTKAAKDSRTYIDDGTRLGDCTRCGGPVLVTHDIQCDRCGECWFWWDLKGVTAANVEDGKNTSVIGGCPSCDGNCYLVGVESTAEAARMGAPRGITGARAKTDMQFRKMHRNALENLGEAYGCVVEATQRLALVEEAIGRLTSLVVDEFDSIEGEPKWPSDAFAYYNEQLGAAGAFRNMANAMAERINDIATGIREHDRRHVRKP